MNERITLLILTGNLIDIDLEGLILTPVTLTVRKREDRIEEKNVSRP
jgi:hypothetical protein